jgi:hypothetical protein
MNEKYPYGIGPGGNWLIFAGLPLSICAIFFVFTAPHDRLAHFAGEIILPYILFFVPAIIMIAGMVLYNRFPKRLIIPFGIAGWVVNFGIFFWFFWFGPGATGN